MQADVDKQKTTETSFCSDYTSIPNPTYDYYIMRNEDYEYLQKLGLSIPEFFDNTLTNNTQPSGVKKVANTDFQIASKEENPQSNSKSQNLVYSNDSRNLKNSQTLTQNSLFDHIYNDAVKKIDQKVPEVKNFQHMDLTSKNTPIYKQINNNNQDLYIDDHKENQDLQNILKRFDVLRCDLAKFLQSSSNIKQKKSKPPKFESSIINTNTNLSVDIPSSLKIPHISDFERHSEKLNGNLLNSEETFENLLYKFNNSPRNKNVSVNPNYTDQSNFLEFMRKKNEVRDMLKHLDEGFVELGKVNSDLSSTSQLNNLEKVNNDLLSNSQLNNLGKVNSDLSSTSQLNNLGKVNNDFSSTSQLNNENIQPQKRKISIKNNSNLNLTEFETVESEILPIEKPNFKKVEKISIINNDFKKNPTPNKLKNIIDCTRKSSLLERLPTPKKNNSVHDTIIQNFQRKKSSTMKKKNLSQNNQNYTLNLRKSMEAENHEQSDNITTNFQKKKSVNKSAQISNNNLKTNANKNKAYLDSLVSKENMKRSSCRISKKLYRTGSQELKNTNLTESKPMSYLDMHRFYLEKKIHPNLRKSKQSLVNKTISKNRQQLKEAAFKLTPDISSVHLEYSSNYDVSSPNVIEQKKTENYDYSPNPVSDENYNTLKAKYHNNYVEENVAEETLNSQEINNLIYNRDYLMHMDDKDITINKIDTIKKNKTKRSKQSNNSNSKSNKKGVENSYFDRLKVINSNNSNSNPKSNNRGVESSYFDRQKVIRNYNESLESTQRSVNSDQDIEIKETQKLIDNLNGFFGTSPFNP